jgi:5-formyltetrahydrofolate cyclo-ligase
MISGRKKKIRNNMLEKRNTLTSEQIESMSKQICETFVSSHEFKIAETIMIYLSFGSEVKTNYIIEYAWQCKKRIVVPSTNPTTRKLIISSIDNYNDLEPGYMGIREPKKHLRRDISKEEINIVVVPAVAFDRKGYRLGYGGGYYDRFLFGMTAYKTGLAFSCQIVNEVPTDWYDLPVDGIITDKEFIKIC